MGGESYYSRLDLNLLEKAFVRDQRLTKIAQYCSKDVVTNLANSIKILGYDFPSGINVTFHNSDQEYQMRITIDSSNLLFSIVDRNSSDLAASTIRILNFEELDEEQTRNELLSALEQIGISYTATEGNEFNLRSIIIPLFNGSSHHRASSYESISGLSENHHYGREADVFALVFRELVDAWIKQKPGDALELLRLFSTNKYYRLPFFRKIVFYTIGENWQATKALFWNLVSNNDSQHFMSSSVYNKEIYEVLFKNQPHLTSHEVETLESIINNGPQYEEESKDTGYWQLRWYSALRNTAFFKEKYQQLSHSLKITHEHYENDGKVTISSGTVPPLSLEEILQKGNEEIVEYIHSFKPEARWSEPNIEGLSEMLGNAVEQYPQKFVDKIHLYEGVYYIYTRRMLYGLEKAWRNGKSFDWTKVLDFCLAYVSSSNFYSGQLNLDNDGWGATHDWVVGAISNLLSTGMHSNRNAFDLTLLPKAKRIIVFLVTKLKPVYDLEQTNMDYPTYSLNSTAGKVLRALLDYSLRRARNLPTDSKEENWESEVIEALENSLAQGIIDGYILVGMYFPQFYFLSKSWSTEKVEKYYKLENRQWAAFIGGYSFSNPISSKEIYRLFHPHYERAIHEHAELATNIYDRSIIRHIVAFYFWGFEGLESRNLLSQLIESGQPSATLGLIGFIQRQRGYSQNLSGEEADNFYKIIYDLWSAIAIRYEDADSEKETEIMSELLRLLEFVPKLNEQYVALILKSIRTTNDHFRFHRLLKDLTRLKFEGESATTANHIGKILNSISFDTYLSGATQQPIVDLITFLYENEQKEIADEVCEKVSKGGDNFLVSLYKEYND